ncbi:MAG: nucleotidyl transferase AbiEii/AbiGii toxin family protein [Candidatus Aminicenantes bacterium]|nr:nucleotidyl transferase AbiEii/AbiGii toxin family protein [Candidatus Aminicenantes bacterium]
MKDYIKQINASAANELQARNMTREYLQARILQLLQESGAFGAWIFHGGTALRFLFSLPRYSEDLDFCLLQPSGTLNLANTVDYVQRALAAENYQVEIKTSGKTAVKSAWLRFPGLLYELGLSSHQNEILSLKLEIDTNPPGGGKTTTTIIRRHVLLNLFHYDQPSLLAGKLHAIFSRPYTKGRDLFDLFWYLSDPTWPDPNIEFLQQALKQSRWSGPAVHSSNWPQVMAQKILTLDWKKVTDDLQPFVERKNDLLMLTRENMIKLLKKSPRSQP